MFHSILLMMRVGPTYYQEKENAIELSSSQPTATPNGTRSVDTKLILT